MPTPTWLQKRTRPPPLDLTIEPYTVAPEGAPATPGLTGGTTGSTDANDSWPEATSSALPPAYTPFRASLFSPNQTLFRTPTGSGKQKQSHPHSNFGPGPDLDRLVDLYSGYDDDKASESRYWSRDDISDYGSSEAQPPSEKSELERAHLKPSTSNLKSQPTRGLRLVGDRVSTPPCPSTAPPSVQHFYSPLSTFRELSSLGSSSCRSSTSGDGKSVDDMDIGQIQTRRAALFRSPSLITGPPLLRIQESVNGPRPRPLPQVPTTAPPVMVQPPTSPLAARPPPPRPLVTRALTCSSASPRRESPFQSKTTIKTTVPVNVPKDIAFVPSPTDVVKRIPTVSSNASLARKNTAYVATTQEHEPGDAITVSIDFGTTFSGVAYGYKYGEVHHILEWPASVETFRKIPTCLVYSADGRVVLWGWEAKNTALKPGMTRCEWFKLYLEPRALEAPSSADDRLPPLPPGKRPINLITDFLRCLWTYAKEQITRDLAMTVDFDYADVWLSVPSAWNAMGRGLMQEAAVAAGIVRKVGLDDTLWRNRIRIITEPEAATIHCMQFADTYNLHPTQNFLVCDAGGGTVDITAYKITGRMEHLEIAEMCVSSGANCGSVFLDLAFQELVKNILIDHPVHLTEASLKHLTKSFSSAEKLTFRGLPSEDHQRFYFQCLNTEDPLDPMAGLIHGQLSIAGLLLRLHVFEPVIEEVLQLIDSQLARVDGPVDGLLLVGGFAASDYLMTRIEERFSDRIGLITRPPNADIATLRGAAEYGLARRTLVSSVIAPRSYIMKVDRAAEPDDRLRRPAYIYHNGAGIMLCRNRLQYLVLKGAILEKGRRQTTDFTKHSQTVHDSIFVATLYTCESDKIMRYADEGIINASCEWTIDLSCLPTFRTHVSMGRMGGFFTDFQIGIELDSAEIRGVLLQDGQQWGSKTFQVFS